MSHADPLRLCNGFKRRDILRIGALSALGLTLGERAIIANPKPKAKSCVLIWLEGGPSHLETFDLKPNAPLEVRGPFGSIPTKVPGVSICEHLPKMAQRMDRLAIIRSMTSPLGEHNLGSHYLLTGYAPTPVLRYPSFGAVTAYDRSRSQSKKTALPPYIAVPLTNDMAREGYLPADCRPFEVGGDPAQPNFQVKNLDLYPGLTSLRQSRRKEFLNSFDQFSRGLDASKSTDPELEQAYRLMESSEAKKAFDLQDESPETRDRYGRRTLGQSCLLARRLVERGVPFITITDRGWDNHESLVLRLKEGYAGAKIGVGLLPTLDQAFSALLDDLSDRRLLDETLVLVMGEFGRTPKLNTRGGRDHWPRVFSVALAGGGVTGGQVIGASDSMGESPLERPVTPKDLAFSIYQLLGIDPKQVLKTPEGRPVAINAGGSAISELFS